MLNSTNVSRLMKSFSMCSIQKARRILTFGQRSIAEKITSVDIYMSNSSAYITTNSIVIWKQLLSEYEKFSMSTKDVNVQQKSKAYFIKKYHPLHHKETEDRRRDRRKILACPEEVFRDRLESLSQMQQLFEKNISVIVTPIYVDEHRNSSYFPPLPLLNLSQIETEPIEQQQHWLKSSNQSKSTLNHISMMMLKLDLNIC